MNKLSASETAGVLRAMDRALAAMRSVPAEVANTIDIPEATGILSVWRDTFLLVALGNVEVEGTAIASAEYERLRRSIGAA